MSLAMTAGQLDGFENEYPIYKKRQQHINKTRKQSNFQNMAINDEKVNSVLQSIHNKSLEDEYEQDQDNFSNPISITNEKKKGKEGMTNQNVSISSIPVPLEPSEMDLQKLETNYMNDDQIKQYYKKMMPGFNQNSYDELKNIKSSMSSMSSTSSNSMIDKLNYIINLLEEQQDQKTNNVTEEVILYSFLGIFIIFVVDGFSRVGKYVR
jgi:hypothetical protein